MAYGQYQSVTITVKTDSGKTILFRAEPSGESGSIGLAEKQLNQVTKATFTPDFCEACLQFLDTDMELEILEIQDAGDSPVFWEKVKKEYLRLNSCSTVVENAVKQFYTLPMSSKLMVLEGISYDLGNVYEEYLRFRDAMGKEVSSIDQIDSVEFAGMDYRWGFDADDKFAWFIREFLPANFFCKYDFEDFWDADDDSEPIKELKEELNKLYGKKLFLGCPLEDIINCFRSPGSPGYFIGERIYTYNMITNQIEKTWKIHTCDVQDDQEPYLVCNDMESTTSNMKKAKELGIPIITEREFVDRFCCPGDFELDEGNGED